MWTFCHGIQSKGWEIGARLLIQVDQIQQQTTGVKVLSIWGQQQLSSFGLFLCLQDLLCTWLLLYRTLAELAHHSKQLRTSRAIIVLVTFFPLKNHMSVHSNSFISHTMILIPTISVHFYNCTSKNTKNILLFVL